MNWLGTTSAVAVGHATSRYVGRIMQVIGVAIIGAACLYSCSGTSDDPTSAVARLDRDRAWCGGYLAANRQVLATMRYLHWSEIRADLGPDQVAELERQMVLMTPQPAGVGKVMITVDGEQVFCDGGFK